MNYNMNMIFYSDNCNTCRNIMMLLQNEGVLGQFKKICVDDCLDNYNRAMAVIDKVDGIQLKLQFG